MKLWLLLAALIGLITALLVQTTYAASKKHLVSAKQQKKLSPAQVLKQLQNGNTRYIKGRSINYNPHGIARHASIKGQHPYAFIFSCIDSRSVPEMVFNQAPGALFVSRIAGNVISPDVLGGMEFATNYAGTKLIVIMGHTQCGAVAGACSKVDHPEQLNHLLQKIDPAVKTISSQDKKLNCQDQHTIDAIAKLNVINQIHALEKQSPSLSKLQAEHKIMVVGAMHNIHSGKVSFFNQDGKSIH